MKATIVGSIVGNILLVLGAAMLAGGMRHQEQHFNESAARAQATMMTLAAIALVTPAAYSALVGELYPGGAMVLSVSISLVLLFVYAMFLLFSLWTHSDLFLGADVLETTNTRIPGRSANRSRCSPEPLSRLHG